MSLACVSIRNEGILAPYANRGVSEEATTIDKISRDVKQEIYGSVKLAERSLNIIRALYEAYQEHSEENWDFYGARAVDLESCDAAWRFMQMLPTAIPIPDISVEPNGNFIFEWYKEPTEVLDVIVENKDTLVYAGLFGVNKSSGTEYFGDEVPETVLGNLKRLLW